MQALTLPTSTVSLARASTAARPTQRAGRLSVRAAIGSVTVQGTSRTQNEDRAVSMVRGSWPCTPVFACRLAARFVTRGCACTDPQSTQGAPVQRKDPTVPARDLRDAEALRVDAARVGPASRIHAEDSSPPYTTRRGAIAPMHYLNPRGERHR